MGSWCFLLLVISIFLSKCLGHTEFIYTVKEVLLNCSTNKWEISTESDNKIDVSCTVECVHHESHVINLNNIQKSCTKSYSDKVGENCPLKASCGFFRCVSALDSGFLYPFKPSPNTVTSYVVAHANEEMTTKSEERSSVELTEGGDVLLNCSFHFTAGYDHQGFTVYWIKTIERSSSCVYSYDLGTYGLMYNHHCNVQEDLLHRLSNKTDSKTSHNIRIRNVTESDAGQYLCVLHVHRHYNKTKGNWKIINNITVSVDKDKGPEISRYNSSDDINTKLIPLYATISALLVLAVIGIIWKKTRTSPRSQAIELQRNQNGEDTKEAADMECSPYAVGIGEEEITFKSKREAIKQGGEEEAAYSVVKQNDLYESGA
ncbi:uncharacterized protein LOC124379935 [Silurus meridionalis]|uniref:Ig-like domain-containing protein n=1 Tax=Silurus meridionalis TaxID=175797 RepID=A0A8T0AAA5_SILME|nr:uncharacterized protein LOC124379935 [Silurus meridionalis]KAF7687928.1 hypothetical protein HF521_013934 [Silurus meridionalis]